METEVQDDVDEVSTVPFTPMWIQCVGQLLFGYTEWKSNEDLGHKISMGKKAARRFVKGMRRPH